MEKLIYVLWPDDSSPDRDAYGRELRGPVARRLADGGARAVQVCVDDSAVADAQVRPAAFDEPARAVVGLWVDRCDGPERGRVEKTLRAHASAVAGYLVTESVPVAMPAPEGPDARVPGFSGVALLRRPEGMDFEYWRSRWQDRHTQVAIDTQGTFGYVQNLVVRAVTPDAPPLAGIVEEQFPEAATTDFYAFYGVDRSRPDAKEELRRRIEAMNASTATFGGAERIDVIPSSRYVPAPGPFG